MGKGESGGGVWRLYQSLLVSQTAEIRLYLVYMRKSPVFGVNEQ